MHAYRCTKNELNLQELCLDFKQRYIPFSNFQNAFFTESLSITAYSLGRGVRCNGLCNVILHMYKNCWKTLWIDSLNDLTNYIPTERIIAHYSGFIFNAFNFHGVKVLSITCACSFPVGTRRRFSVYKTSIRRRRRRIDVL